MRFAWIALLVLAGCSEKKDATVTGPCGGSVNCPNERAPALADKCPVALEEPICGGAFGPYYECLKQNQVCNGLGRYDQSAMDVRCKDVTAAYKACIGEDAGVAADTLVEDTFVAEDTFTPEDTARED